MTQALLSVTGLHRMGKAFNCRSKAFLPMHLPNQRNRGSASRPLAGPTKVGVNSFPLRVASVIVCMCGFAFAADVTYRFSSSGNYPGAAFTFLQAVNCCEIVGYYESSSASFGYLENVRQSGTGRFLNLQPPGSVNSYASGINAKGVVVGGFCGPIACNPLDADHGFTYSDGAYTTIDYPQTGATTAPYGINGRGDIVGGFCAGPYACPVGAFARTAHGFLDRNGVFTELDFPASQDTQANAINDSGTIVGAYDVSYTGPHGFIYQNGTFTNIDVPGATFTYPDAINNRGVIAGSYQLNLDTIHGFLRYKDGTVVTVDHPNTQFSSIEGINDAGVIVGNWSSPHGQGFQLPFKGVPANASP